MNKMSTCQNTLCDTQLDAAFECRHSASSRDRNCMATLLDQAGTCQKYLNDAVIHWCLEGAATIMGGLTGHVDF